MVGRAALSVGFHAFPGWIISRPQRRCRRKSSARDFNFEAACLDHIAYVLPCRAHVSQGDPTTDGVAKGGRCRQPDDLALVNDRFTAKRNRFWILEGQPDEAARDPGVAQTQERFASDE